MALRDPVKQESEFYYTSKLSGKQFRFEPKPDEIVATFQTQPTVEIAESVSEITSLELTQTNPTQEFAVFKVPSGLDSAAAIASLATTSEIANSIPVMIDQEGLTRYFIPDMCEVQFRDDVSEAEAQQIIEAMGSSIVVKQRTLGYYAISIPAGKGLFDTIRNLINLDKVVFAEPREFGLDDALVYLPDDTDFARLWGLRNTGQMIQGNAGTAGADIDAIHAWDISRGDPNVFIAVIDTGVDLDHVDLAANIFPRGNEDWDFANLADRVPEDEDVNFHGTHVSGTSAAVDDTAGVIGVAPQCRLIPLRVDLTSGMNANRADAINYVRDLAVANPNNRYVINCSWRMNGDHDGIRNAIASAVANNVVVVFAAGNNNQDIDMTPQYPAVYPQVIAVAATDNNDVKAGFSNFGTLVDISAPGVDIWSTIGGDGHGFLSGTSMASPHVAGLAALVWSVKRNLINHQTRKMIERTCDDLDTANPTFAGQLGRGRINAFRALTLAQTPMTLSLRQLATCLGISAPFSLKNDIFSLYPNENPPPSLNTVLQYMDSQCDP